MYYLPGGVALTPNGVVPKPPLKIGFGGPNVAGDPNTGLVLNLGVCPKIGCAPNTGCSTPIGDVLTAAPPNTDGDPAEDNPEVTLFVAPPKKDAESVFDAESNIKSDFGALLSNMGSNVFIEEVFPPNMEPDEDTCVFPPKIELVLLPLKIEPLVEAVVILLNINVFEEFTKGLKKEILASGFPNVLAVEETAGVVENWELIVREDLSKTGTAVVVAIFPNVSVDEVGVVIILVIAVVVVIVGVVVVTIEVIVVLVVVLIAVAVTTVVVVIAVVVVLLAAAAVLMELVGGNIMVLLSKGFDKAFWKGVIVEEVIFAVVFDVKKLPNIGMAEVIVVCITGVAVVTVHVVVGVEFDISSHTEVFNVFFRILNKGVAEGSRKSCTVLVGRLEVDSERGASSIVTDL